MIRVFNKLIEVGYEWSPVTPDQLLQYRKSNPFRPLVQLFGLGACVQKDRLFEDGLSLNEIKLFEELNLVEVKDDAVQPLKAISRQGDLFIIHDHWPPKVGNEDEYIHYGAESVILSRILQDHLDIFVGKKILDLGCSSGALSFELTGVAEMILGIDASSVAIEWARKLFNTYHCSGGNQDTDRVVFYEYSIGSQNIDSTLKYGLFDYAVFNPPMVLSQPGSHFPHRDGGLFGIELPLLFLSYAMSRLKKNGEVFCLMTNPVINGKDLLFNELKKIEVKIIKKKCIRPNFNKNILDQIKNKVDAYSKLEKTELWYLHLIKK